jgi:hypothetical protein
VKNWTGGKAGRPKSSDQKARHLDVRLTVEQLQRIEAAASSRGETTAQWARNVLLNACESASDAERSKLDRLSSDFDFLRKQIHSHMSSNRPDPVATEVASLHRTINELVSNYNKWATGEFNKMNDEAPEKGREMWRPQIVLFGRKEKERKQPDK